MRFWQTLTTRAISKIRRLPVGIRREKRRKGAATCEWLPISDRILRIVLPQSDVRSKMALVTLSSLT